MIFFFAYVCSAGAQLFDAPANVSLSPDVNSITVEWDSMVNADHYYIYWGTTRDLANERIRVEGQRQYEITDLEPDTRYFFAVSAVVSILGEGRRSDIIAENTLPEDSPTGPPANFWIIGMDDIGETSVGLKWDRMADSDPDRYRIFFGTASGVYETTMDVDGSKHNVIVDGLDFNTRYYFTIASISETDEGLIFESEKAAEIVVDTLPDNRPPDIPERIRGRLSGEGEITINVDAGNENMVDFAGVVLHYGQSPGPLTESIDIGKQNTHVLSGLIRQSTWDFEAVSYDYAGNISEPAEKISVNVEEIQSYTEGFDDFNSGCFIGSLTGRQNKQAPSYDVTRNKNKLGISGGYFLPHQTEFDDFYGRDNYPLFLFYERSLHRYLTVDFKAGYMRSKGNLRAVESGIPTRVDATFTMIPTSASINVRYPLAPYVWGFAGIGPDYWYIRETSALETFDNISKWTGGYHGRAGIWLYNTDIRYRRWGMLIETQYSVVDRFGENDIDVGGWLFLIGGFYSF